MIFQIIFGIWLWLIKKYVLISAFGYLTQALKILISWVVGVIGASLRVSVLVPDRRASKSPVTSKWWPCLWTRTCLGAWVPRWLHWKSQDTFLRQAGLGACLHLDKYLLQLGQSMNNRIQKGQNPTTKQCPERDPCRQPLQEGGQITQHDPLARPHPRPT